MTHPNDELKSTKLDAWDAIKILRGGTPFPPGISVDLLADTLYEAAFRHCSCSACQKTHASDCAVHNMPAMPNGPCNCGTVENDEAYLSAIREISSLKDQLSRAKDEAKGGEAMPSWLKERCAHAIRQAYADYVHWTGGDVDHRDIQHGQSKAAVNAVLKEMVAFYTSPRPTADEERDAARYRYLRGSDINREFDVCRDSEGGFMYVLLGKELDQAIDAAMAERGDNF